MKTFDPMAPVEPTIPEIHIEIPNPDNTQRSACAACPDVKGGWPCPTLREHRQANRDYVWSLRDALQESLRALYAERMEEFAKEQESQGRPDNARRARERAKYADDDRAWSFLEGLQGVFEVPGYGHYQVVSVVTGTEICNEWSDWSSPRAIVIAEQVADVHSGQTWNDRYFMITGKNRSHYGTEWDYAQFSEVKPKVKTLTTWEGVH